MGTIFRERLLHNEGLLWIVAVIFGLLTVVSLGLFITKLIKPNAKIGELISRTKSWWVMAILFIGATIFNTKISYVAIAFLSFIAFRELYSILGFRQSDRRSIFWAFLSIPIQYYLAYIGWYGAFIIFIPVIMFLLLPMRMVIKGDTKGIVHSMATLQWALMLTVFGLSHLAYLLSLPELPTFKGDGRCLLIFLVFLTEINDVFQFTWGKLFGRHKIIPKVSPNKTWEGFLGGVVSTTATGYFLVFLTPFNTWQILLVSFMIAVSGFVGDVVMSSIKRDIGVKDTGSIIPGHGGILDRIDSLAYTAPAFFHLVYYICY